MAEGLNIITFFSSVIGIIAIVLGIDISRKVFGKLKTLLILLISTTAIFTIGEVMKIIKVLGNLQIEYSEEIIKIIIALFLLATMFGMKHVIEHLGKMNEREKRKK